MAETLGAKFSIDVSQLQQGLRTANKLIRESESQFKKAAAGMDDWSKSEEGLKARISSLNEITAAQREKVKALKENYQNLINQGLDPTSDKAIQLRTQINNEEAALVKNEQELKKNTEALDKLGQESTDTGKEINNSTKSFDNLSKVASTASKAVAAAAVAIGAAAVAIGKKMWDMAKATAEAGNEIDKESQKLGISAENYQKLSYAMEISGADINDLKKGVKTITKDIAGMENGTKGAGKSFEALGISVRKNDGTMKSSEEVLLDSIDALSKMENETQRNALAQEIFGRSAAELNPLLNAGADGIRELMQEAEEYGMIMSDDAVKASAKFEDSLLRLKGTAEGLRNTLMSELLPSLTTVVNGFSDLMAGKEGAGEEIEKGISNLISNISTMIPKFVDLTYAIMTAIIENLPTIFQSLSDAIIQQLPRLATIAIDVIMQLAQTLLSMTPQILDTGIQILVALINGITEAIPQLAEMLPEIINTICTVLIENLPVVLEAAIQLLTALIDAIPVIVTAMSENLPTIIDTIINTLLNNMPMLINASIQLFMALLKAIPVVIVQLIKNIPTIITSIVKALTSPEALKSIANAGVELIKGLWNGIKSMSKWIWEKIQGFGKGVLDGLKSFFGIHSPSTVMENVIGKNLALGIGKGFEKNIAGVNKEIQAAMNFDSPTVNVNRSITGSSNDGYIGSGQVVNVYQTNNYSQAHSRYEIYKSKQQTAAAVRLAMGTV